VKLLSADTFVSGTQDGKISLWRETKKSPLYTIESAHGNAGTSPRWITSLSAIPGTNSFVSGSYDGNIKVWVVEDDIVSQIGQIEIDGCVNSLAYSKRYVVAAASREPRLGRWFTVDDCKDKISLFNLKEY
jgi:ribosomal RNA-processing protein 9